MQLLNCGSHVRLEHAQNLLESIPPFPVAAPCSQRPIHPLALASQDCLVTARAAATCAELSITAAMNVAITGAMIQRRISSPPFGWFPASGTHVSRSDAARVTKVFQFAVMSLACADAICGIVYWEASG